MGSAAQGFSTPPAAAASASMATSLPLRREETSVSEPSSWMAGAALAFIALGGGVMALRRGRWPALAAKKPLQPGGRVERLSSQALTAQASVHAIRWHGEELLLACSSQQVTVLARRPAAQGEQA